jgi:hypothetical protein
MAITIQRLPRACALMAILASSLWFGSGARADNQVTLRIAQGPPVQAYIIASEQSAPIAYSERSQRTAVTLLLFVRDPRGTSQGWSVNVATSDLRLWGTMPNDPVTPGERFIILATGEPIVLAGQPLAPGGPTHAPSTGASFASPRTVLWASPGAGSGEYLQLISAAATVPGRGQIELFIANFTVGIASAP